MEVTIKQVNSYEITIGKETFTGFTKVSEWNGMVEFNSQQGKVIVANKSGVFENIFAGLLSKEGDVNGKDYQIVQVSPYFLEQLDSKGAKP